jgi:hypothetical protein
MPPEFSLPDHGRDTFCVNCGLAQRILMMFGEEAVNRAGQRLSDLRLVIRSE